MAKDKTALAVNAEVLDLVNELVSLRTALHEDIRELKSQLHVAQVLWAATGDGDDASGVRPDCCHEGKSASQN
jgi:hypothetical protein